MSLAIKFAIQINGKTRDILTVQKDISEKDITDIVMKNSKAKKHIENKKVSNQSFYAGDALGRENDWSDSDKIFAINCGLKYISPEEIFPFVVIIV